MMLAAWRPLLPAGEEQGPEDMKPVEAECLPHSVALTDSEWGKATEAGSPPHSVALVDSEGGEATEKPSHEELENFEHSD